MFKIRFLFGTKGEHYYIEELICYYIAIFNTYGHCDLWKQISLVYQKFIYQYTMSTDQGLVYRSSPIKGVWPSSLDQSLPLSFMPPLLKTEYFQPILE